MITEKFIKETELLDTQVIGNKEKIIDHVLRIICKNASRWNELSLKYEEYDFSWHNLALSRKDNFQLTRDTAYIIFVNRGPGDPHVDYKLTYEQLVNFDKFIDSYYKRLEEQHEKLLEEQHEKLLEGAKIREKMEQKFLSARKAYEAINSCPELKASLQKEFLEELRKASNL